MRYFVEFMTKSVTTILVTADTQQQAIDTVLRQEGDVLNIRNLQTKLQNVRPLPAYLQD
jgi:hypothetical protein